MRKFFSILMVAIMLVAFAACGSGGGSNGEVNKYNVYLDIEFEQNLIFALYDVEVYFDVARVGLIPHGKHFTNLIESVEEGSHKLYFYKDGDHSVQTTKDVKVAEDCTVIATVHSNKNSIEIKGYELRSGIAGDSLTMIDVVGENLGDAVNALKQIGFTNINYSSDVWDTSNWEVVGQNHEGGEVLDKNTKIELTCKKIGEAAPDDQSAVDADEVLTADNNEELAAIINSEYVDPEKQEAFAEKYKGKIIEFDCIVFSIERYENYNTRFNYVLVPGTDADDIRASMFLLENVGYYDFKLDKDNRPDSVDWGSLLHMQAEVRGSEDIYILLKPVKTTFKGMANIQ